MIKIQNNFSGSRGVTLVEVIFSMGVVLVGILGVLAVLPLAGNRATDAVNLNTAAMLSDSIAKDVIAGDQHVVLREADLTPMGTLPISHTVTVGGVTITYNRPFCIDPLLAASSPGASSGTSYISAFFPYYQRNHDPMLDPSIDSSSPAPPVTGGLTGQPRLLRVGPNVLSTLAAGAQQQEMSRLIAENQDDLDAVLPTDRSRPAVLTSLSAVTSGITGGTRVVNGQYSWIITVDPFEDTDYASMSVVVMKNRERAIQFPAGPVASPRLNMLSERVAFVAPGSATGFSGGSGGSVTLLSAGNTLSKLKSGDWLMISTDLTSGSTGNALDDVHRWFRVVDAAGDATLVTPSTETNVAGFAVPAPANSTPPAPVPATRIDNPVWQRTVILDGPDWSFGAGTHFATLVEGVVAVSEQTVSLAAF